MFELRSFGPVLFAILLSAMACSPSSVGDDDEGDGFGDESDDSNDTGDSDDSDDSGDESDDDGATSPDGGPGGECESEVITAPTAPACAAATLTCMEACETEECFDACMAADPNPEPCSTCLDDSFVACANQMGCQEEWDAEGCCYEECDDPESAACESSCASQTQAYENCTTTVEETCDAAGDVCFAS